MFLGRDLEDDEEVFVIDESPTKVPKNFVPFCNRKSNYFKFFDKMIDKLGRTHKLLLDQAKYAKPPHPINPRVDENFKTVANQIKSYRDRHTLFRQLESSFIEPGVKRMFNRFIRVQVQAVFTECIQSKDGMIICVEVVPGSKVPDGEELLEPIVLEPGHVDPQPMIVKDHKRECPYHPAGPNAYQMPDFHPPPRSISNPQNHMPPTGTRILLQFPHEPIPRQYVHVNETILRIYPDWTVRHMPYGVTQCCINYHYVIMNAYNVSIETAD